MITHRFPLFDALEAFGVARRREAVTVTMLPGIERTSEYGA